MSLWPSGVDVDNLLSAWRDAEISHYFFNTLKIAVGSWADQLVVAATGGYVLGILRPWYTRIVTAGVMVMLFVPPIVLLVPLFLTVLDMPVLDRSLLNTYWAVCLPAGASAFNVVLVKRFFENSQTRSSRRRRSTEPARFDCSGRSCCRCRSRSSGWCRSLRC